MPDISRWSWLKWLWISAAVVATDYVSKRYFQNAFQYGEVRYVAPFFNWVLVYNTGAAFSLLANASGWQREFFIVLTLAISSFLLWMLAKNPRDRWLAPALALILGGAAGNLIDRVMYGHVIDFVQLHAGGYYWPAFNVADSAISVGAAMLVLDSFRKRPDPSAGQEAETTDPRGIPGKKA